MEFEFRIYIILHYAHTYARAIFPFSIALNT